MSVIATSATSLEKASQVTSTDSMRAIVITKPGGPEVLALVQRPKPQPAADEILIAVKAFGLNRAEIYFRRGLWGEVAEISGIECVGIVAADPAGQFATGQKVIGLLGGMGRSRNGSYAGYVTVPRTNVVAVETDLSWADLAALPESYATAWTCLTGNLHLTAGQWVLIRGATSALGQAAINIAKGIGARVIATTRRKDRVAQLRQLGADHVLVGEGDIAAEIRSLVPGGVDAVLELIGCSSLPDSLAATRRDGRVCLVGVLGGTAALTDFNPLFQMPSGVHFSVFASAFVFGTPAFPLSEIPFQSILDRAAQGLYQAKPARVFAFDDLPAAQILMEGDAAGGKIVVVL